MKEILLEPPKIVEETEKKFLDDKRVRRWTLVLYFSTIAGITSAISGLVLGAVSYLDFFGKGETVNQIGNLMIIAAFPLMMFSAHALDKINEIKSKQKQL
jgi:hypothetical protein